MQICKKAYRFTKDLAQTPKEPSFLQITVILLRGNCLACARQLPRNFSLV